MRLQICNVCHAMYDDSMKIIRGFEFNIWNQDHNVINNLYIKSTRTYWPVSFQGQHLAVWGFHLRLRPDFGVLARGRPHEQWQGYICHGSHPTGRREDGGHHGWRTGGGQCVSEEGEINVSLKIRLGQSGVVLGKKRGGGVPNTSPDWPNLTLKETLGEVMS